MTPGRCPGPKATEIRTAPPEAARSLSVTDVVVYFRVTRLAQGHEVVSCVSTTLRNRFYMMHLLNRGESAFLEALLTQRMLRSIAVTDAFPRSAVLFVDVGVTLVSVVLLSRLFPMCFTILTVCKVGTAGITARSLGFAWHLFTSVQGKKSPRGTCVSREGLWIMFDFR